MKTSVKERYQIVEKIEHSVHTKCSVCDSSLHTRLKRKFWMRLFPGTHLYRCIECESEYIVFLERMTMGYKKGYELQTAENDSAESNFGIFRTATDAGTATIIHPHADKRERDMNYSTEPSPEIIPDQQPILSTVTRDEVKKYFKLACHPFNVTPDPSFMYFSRNHQRVLSELLCAIEDRQGYVTVTGAIGTGKTTLCRALLNRLTHDVHTALIVNPNLSEKELLSKILEDFGIQSLGKTKKALIDQLNEFLLNLSRHGMTAVLILDEAQNMTPKTLENVRMLSNFETNSSKLLQTILVGQPELRDLLARENLTQLRQRISVWCQLTELSKSDTEAYIEHRLNIACGEEKILFHPEAIDLIYEYSHGTPRVINTICDRALKLACLKNTRAISRQIANLASTLIGSPSL